MSEARSAHIRGPPLSKSRAHDVPRASGSLFVGGGSQRAGSARRCPGEKVGRFVERLPAEALVDRPAPDGGVLRQRGWRDAIALGGQKLCRLAAREIAIICIRHLSETRLCRTAPVRAGRCARTQRGVTVGLTPRPLGNDCVEARPLPISQASVSLRRSRARRSTQAKGPSRPDTLQRPSASLSAAETPCAIQGFSLPSPFASARETIHSHVARPSATQTRRALQVPQLQLPPRHAHIREQTVVVVENVPLRA